MNSKSNGMKCSIHLKIIAILAFFSLFITSISNKFLSNPSKVELEENMEMKWKRFMDFPFSNVTFPSPSYSNIYNTSNYSFEIPELKRLCESAQWKDNKTMFKPLPISMGTFNARNKILNSIRMSIAAGLHLVMPKLLIRSENLIGLNRGDGTSMDYLFDIDHLRSILSINCPQMVIRESEDVSRDTMWRSAGDEKTGTTQEFKRLVDRALEKNPGASILHSVGLIYLDVDGDGMEMRKDWWKILRTRPKMVEMADQIVRSFQNSNFAGIHLRLERDMINRFKEILDRYNLTFENYAEWSLKFIEQHHRKGDVIYVAVGDQNLAERMGNEIRKRGFVYASKWTWAKGIKGMKEHLLSEGWDAIGLVDYHVMLRSKTFVGLEQSTFSYVVALARELFQTKQLGKTIAPNTLLFGPYPSQYLQSIW